MALRPSHGPLLYCHSLITVIVTVIVVLLLQKLEERTVGAGECAPTKALLFDADTAGVLSSSLEWASNAVYQLARVRFWMIGE